MNDSLHTIEQAALSLVIRESEAFDHAQALAVGGSPEQALGAYVAIGISQAERHYQDALALLSRNDTAGLIIMLKWCVAANPEHFHGWLNLAQLHAEAEGEKYCRRALAIMPGNPDAIIRLADLLLADNQRLQAAELLMQLGAVAGESFETQFGLASLWWKLGNFNEAEPALRRCIDMNRSDVRPYQMLLEQLHRQDRLADVESLCRSFLELQPADQQMRIELAGSLVRQQRWADAEAIYFGLLAESQDSVPLRQLYAQMLEKCGRLTDALAIFKDNVVRQPDNLNISLRLVDFLHNAGNVAEARELCRSLARNFSESESWKLHVLPGALQQRLIFHELEDIAAKYCTGERALIDNTGLNLSQADFGFGEVVEFFCMVVGKEHVDYLEHIAYPAMAATEGFEDLLRERKAIYNIYTTPADFKLLDGFLGKLEQHGIRYRVNVELLAFSQELYSILALPIIDQIKRSLALRSAVVMALPDAIISGSIYRVLQDMKPFETVVCAMPRIDSDIAGPELRKFFSESEGMGLDTREFVRRSMTDFLHPQTYSALNSESNCLRYRDAGGYYSARNWAPPPLCFYGREEMLDHMIRNPLCGPHSMASFYAIDHDIIDSAWRSENLRLIPDSDYFFWAEFTHSGRHTNFLEGRKAEDYYAPESSRHIFEHEFKWIYAD